MFRLSSFFSRSAYTAPANPVIDPAAAADATPDTPRIAQAGCSGSDATARARALAEKLSARGVAIPVLMARFPHVVDRIATAWGDPALLAAMFEDLLVDDRGGRQGFPREAAQELFAVHRCAAGRPVEHGTRHGPAPK
jgi:hypothetical protein